MSIRRSDLLGVVVCLLASVLTVVGQARQQSSTSAVIAGVVVDSGGGVIPGATVDLARQGKSIATRVTNALGQFRFDGLEGGDYVEHPVLDDLVPLGHGSRVQRAGARLDPQGVQLAAYGVEDPGDVGLRLPVDGFPEGPPQRT